MNRTQRRKKEKELKKIAQRIINLEEQMRLGKDVKSAQNKIQEIMSALSTEEMLMIDDYIIGSRKLTK